MNRKPQSKIQNRKSKIEAALTARGFALNGTQILNRSARTPNAERRTLKTQDISTQDITAEVSQ